MTAAGERPRYVRHAQEHPAGVGEAIREARAAADAVAVARAAMCTARDGRRDVFRELWPRLYRVGTTQISRRLGRDFAGAPSTLNSFSEGLEPRRKRGPRPGGKDLVLTDDEAGALAQYAAACQARVDARDEYRQALIERSRVLRRIWPAVRHLGPTALARELEGVQEWTIRHAVEELRWR